MFRAWTVSRRSDKERLLFQKKGPEDLLPKWDEHYSAVLKMFDTAILAIKSSTKTSMRLSKVDTDALSALPVRRSAHIRDHGRYGVDIESESPPPLCSHKKCRLDEDKEVPHPRAKRAKKAHRDTRRPH
jgi:hypothetical protein